jgi:hypothetical protein
MWKSYVCLGLPHTATVDSRWLVEKNWWNSGNTYYCANLSTTHILSPDIVSNTPQWVSKTVNCSIAMQFAGKFFKKKSETQRIKSDFIWHCETLDRPQYAQYQTQQCQWQWKHHVVYLPRLTRKSQTTCTRHSRTLCKPSVLKQPRHYFLAQTLWSNDWNWIIKRFLFCTEQQLGVCHR